MPGIKLPPLPQGYSERPWYYEGGLFTQGQMYYYANAALESPEVQALRKDAERYRFLAAYCRSTDEHWGGRWSIVVDGPCPASRDSEDDFDEAIDAAMEKQK